jgi:hypothetical protein
MDLDEIEKQQEQDRKELEALPSGSNKPLSWCSEHDCKMGTCFPLHYPNSLEVERQGLKHDICGLKDCECGTRDK